jgi:hypothetical protein
MRKFTALSSDIENDDLELSIDSLTSGEYVIDSIIDVFNEPEEDMAIVESGLVAIDADLTNKPIKRGDVVYITALVKKKGASMSSPASQSVLKLRVVDIYAGLNYLNKIMKDK